MLFFPSSWFERLKWYQMQCLQNLKWYQMQCLQNLPNLCHCRTPRLCTWCTFCLQLDFRSSALAFHQNEVIFKSRLNINIFNIYNVHNIYSNICRINTSSRFLSLNGLRMRSFHCNWRNLRTLKFWVNKQAKLQLLQCLQCLQAVTSKFRGSEKNTLFKFLFFYICFKTLTLSKVHGYIYFSLVYSGHKNRFDIRLKSILGHKNTFDTRLGSTLVWIHWGT